MSDWFSSNPIKNRLVNPLPSTIRYSDHTWADLRSNFNQIGFRVSSHDCVFWFGLPSMVIHEIVFIFGIGQIGFFGWTRMVSASPSFNTLFIIFFNTDYKKITSLPSDCDCCKTVRILNSEIVTGFKLFSSLHWIVHLVRSILLDKLFTLKLNFCSICTLKSI